LWAGQASGVSLLAKAGLFETSDESGQLVFGLGRAGIDLLEVVGEQLVDLELEGVELLNGLLEDVADHQLGAVVGVKLEGRVEQGGEGLILNNVTLSALVAVSRLDWPADVVSVDLSGDQLLLGDGNSGDNDDGQ